MKTTNLELSKKLKEAGYPQRSSFWWHLLLSQLDYIDPPLNKRYMKSFISAPTADELLDLLPHFLKGEYIEVWKEQWGHQMVWLIGFEGLCSFNAESLADTAAKLWLYLKENDLLGVK